MSKLYTVAGASVQDGVFKYRVANDMDRAAHLARAGHEWVKLFVLPEAMSKDDAILYIANTYPTLAKEASSGVMDRVVADQQRTSRSKKKLTDEQRAELQFQQWREAAKKKFDFLVD